MILKKIIGFNLLLVVLNPLLLMKMMIMMVLRTLPIMKQIQMKISMMVIDHVIL